MRAILRVIMILLALAIPQASAWTQPQLSELPQPIRDYAEALKPYCEVIGKHSVIANGIYSDRLFGDIDVNRDGLRDYIVYKCMFGCDDEPYALQGLGPQCMFGSLLLSSPEAYRAIPIPGQLSQFEAGDQVRVTVYRAHIQRQDCGGAWYCNYVFELRYDWFRLVDVCPQSGCLALLTALQKKDDLLAAGTNDQGD
jgi:hypothetical protein